MQRQTFTVWTPERPLEDYKGQFKFLYGNEFASWWDSNLYVQIKKPKNSNADPLVYHFDLLSKQDYDQLPSQKVLRLENRMGTRGRLRSNEDCVCSAPDSYPEETNDNDITVRKKREDYYPSLDLESDDYETRFTKRQIQPAGNPTNQN